IDFQAMLALERANHAHAPAVGMQRHPGDARYPQGKYPARTLLPIDEQQRPPGTAQEGLSRVLVEPPEPGRAKAAFVCQPGCLAAATATEAKQAGCVGQQEQPAPVAGVDPDIPSIRGEVWQAVQLPGASGAMNADEGLVLVGDGVVIEAEVDARVVRQRA